MEISKAFPVRPALLLSICLPYAALHAQTTQGLISGRILNSVTGQPVEQASISYTSTTLAAGGIVKSDATGYYFLPLLSAGTYTIRATSEKFQAQELQQLGTCRTGFLHR